MAVEPYLGEIRMVSFSFPPTGWALCNGQLLPINQNQALFSLIGTTYGGDGRTTFALPDLRGRVPMHQGQGPGLSNQSMGEAGGQEFVTLSTAQLPAHSHQGLASTGAETTNNPSNAYPARGGVYSSAHDTDSGAGDVTGGGQPHNNLQPYLVVSFIIALQGDFPSSG